MHSFLFELGVEELPENVILPAITYLQASFEKMLQEKGLSCGQIKVGSTPRRLSIWAYDLPARQEDSEICKAGPSMSIAYSKEGELSRAGEGFLKKSGGSLEDIFIQKTEKGEFLACTLPPDRGKYHRHPAHLDFAEYSADSPAQENDLAEPGPGLLQAHPLDTGFVGQLCS